MSIDPASGQSPSNLRGDWIVAMAASAAVIVAAAGILYWNNTAFPATGHSHGSASAASAVGKPGDPAIPARTIEVAMLDDNGVMKYEPSAFAVAKGEQIRFRITNRGVLDHEFVLATLKDNLDHMEAMRKLPDMKHASPNSVTLKPGESAEILWQFTNAGSFDISCLIPGHREAGMHGDVIVR